VKRYPTMPTVSRISFDFLHYIRPPPGSAAVPKESFEQLVHFLTSWNCRRHDSGASMKNEDVNGRDTNARHDKRGIDPAAKTKSGLTVNLLRNLCHVFYFDCNQVWLRGVLCMIYEIQALH